jgi:hypothetical protein
MTPVERMARAICRSEECRQLYQYDEDSDQMIPSLLNWEFNGEYDTLDKAVDGNWKDYIDQARAALAAIREPSEAMRRAAYPHLPHASLEALRVWQSMNDAALKEEPTP